MPDHTNVEIGTLQTERLPNGKRRLLSDLTVVINDREYIVPQGYETDFSSVPWFGRFIVRWSKIDIAGVVHDYLYDYGDDSRSSADWVWYQIAISGAHRANLLQAWIFWMSLVLFGWLAWDRSRKTPVIRQVIRACLIVAIVGGFSWFGWNLFANARHKSDQAEWTRKFKARGANVHMSGYGGAPEPLRRIPIVRELFVKVQFEVVIPDTKTAIECHDLLETCPHIERLWIHKLNVDLKRMRQIKQMHPDVMTVQYTGNL